MAKCVYKNTDDLPVIMSVKDLQNVLGIHSNNVYELVKKPGFPSIRVSERRIVIPRDRFLQWLDNSADAKLAQ